VLPTLGAVRTFTENDVDVVRDLTIDLYQIRQARIAPSAPSLKNRLRSRVFGALAGHRPDDRSEPLIATNVRSILLFRYDALGDYVVTTPLIDAIRTMAPNVAIDVVASSRNVSLLRADPRFRRIVVLHPQHAFHPSWLRLRRLAQEESYDAIVAAVFTRMTKAAVLAAMAGRNAKTVTVRHDERAAIYGKVFDIQVPHHTPEHWACTMERMAQAMLKSDIPAPPLRQSIPLDNVATNHVIDQLSERGIAWNLRESANVVGYRRSPTIGRKYVVVNVSAYSPNRNWSVHACTRAISMLAAEWTDLHFFISGAPSAADNVNEIVQQVSRSNVSAWKGTILELLALIAGSDIVISPDTATIHIAAAADVPCVVLFAELIKVAEWYPLGVPFRAILSDNPESLVSIPATTVAEMFVDLYTSRA